MAKLVVLIEAETVRGLGTESSPSRTVTQWFRTDGTQVAEYDPTFNPACGMCCWQYDQHAPECPF